ncbi:hypothetical protein ACLESD_50585, partial [Pyxidicoccus sp. 3LFB2]
MPRLPLRAPRLAGRLALRLVQRAVVIGVELLQPLRAQPLARASMASTSAVRSSMDSVPSPFSSKAQRTRQKAQCARAGPAA